MPKRDQSGMREPTAFDGDPPGRRASCVQQLAAQPKEPVTDGVCAAPWQLQCLCRLMQTLTVSAARCRRKRFSVGGDDEQAAACASGAAGAGPDGPASAAGGGIDPADRCARLAALPAKKWFIPEAKIAEWLGCEDSSNSASLSSNPWPANCTSTAVLLVGGMCSQGGVDSFGRNLPCCQP